MHCWVQWPKVLCTQNTSFCLVFFFFLFPRPLRVFCTVLFPKGRRFHLFQRRKKNPLGVNVPNENLLFWINDEPFSNRSLLALTINRSFRYAYIKSIIVHVSVLRAFSLSIYLALCACVSVCVHLRILLFMAYRSLGSQIVFIARERERERLDLSQIQVLAYKPYIYVNQPRPPPPLSCHCCCRWR